MRLRMEIEGIIGNNKKKVIIASAAFLSAWGQCVQRPEHISGQLVAGSFQSHCALPICFYNPDGTLFTGEKYR